MKAIRESRSPHRSVAFIVRNHSEIVRGKLCMVINYKRFNDNTVDDAYIISNKQEWMFLKILINYLKNTSRWAMCSWYVFENINKLSMYTDTNS
jgi:hypothetical protein